jgi:hypothetical protein
MPCTGAFHCAEVDLAVAHIVVGGAADIHLGQWLELTVRAVGGGTALQQVAQEASTLEPVESKPVVGTCCCTLV